VFIVLLWVIVSGQSRLQLYKEGIIRVVLYGGVQGWWNLWLGYNGGLRGRGRGRGGGYSESNQ